MPMKRPLLSLSVDSAADDAAEAKRADRFSADMAAVDRDSFRCVRRSPVPRVHAAPSQHRHPPFSSRHLVDDVFTIKGIGQGASGVVYLACHAPTLRLLALKSVSVGDEAAEAAVMLELHAEHENLVPLTATGGMCERCRRLPLRQSSPADCVPPDVAPLPPQSLCGFFTTDAPSVMCILAHRWLPSMVPTVSRCGWLPSCTVPRRACSAVHAAAVPATWMQLS